jgi:glutathione S-transferase
MKLYFSPLACSLAARIALYEAGADAHFEQVDTKAKRTARGADFRNVHPLGLVPVLELPSGAVITENAAVLQRIAHDFPDARLGATGLEDTTRLQQWLCFIGTELHKALFIPLLDPQAPPDAKAYALAKAESRLSFLSGQLAGRDYLLDHFSVADAYLFTILNWTMATPVDLEPWPTLVAYQARLRERPSVARAFREELALYRAEQAQAPHHAPPPRTTAAVIERFNAAFLGHEPTLLDDLVDEGCLLENTTPAPLGSRHVGRAACLAVWREIATNRGANFELEGVDIDGERAQIRWCYVWGSGELERVRGVNLMRVRDGRIVEARGYVKGAS